jgi:transposase InsO family protein
MSDLASRYRLDPLVSFEANGHEIAAWVDQHCEQRGAPLFMKRDNGSPLNHHAVNEVLERRGIIPLNSPPHYPRYNGMIENSVRELKDDAELRQAPPEGWKIAPSLQRVQAAVRTRNHIPRRCLGRRTAHDVYTSGRREWTIEERRAILDWLRIRQCEIIQSIVGAGPRAQAKAWRQAVEEWLVSNGHIRIHKPTKQNQIVSPYFSDSMGHN